MSTVAPTFDESWHLVEGRCLRLRPAVHIVAQRFRGRRWYVVQDALGNQFFRVQPPAYRFICELERCATVGEAWERSLEIDPQDAPGQTEVVQLLSQLHQSGLLRGDLEGDVASLFAAQEKQQQRKVRSTWANLFFLRIPLFNPDNFIRTTLPLVRGLISPLGGLLWLALLLWGAKEIVENWHLFKSEGGALLGTANLPWLYATMVFIKALHEFGHGYACRKFGGEVPQMGVMLLLFNPLPYVDASSSWALRNKWQRILIGGAGMIVELALAAVAAMLWAHTGDGALHRVAYNAIVIASVGTLLFNLNPLLRYDGYHMLSDFLEMPNLQGRASQTTLYLLERYGFGLTEARNPASSRRETWALTAYFFASLIYRTVLLVGILFFISQKFFVLGVLLALGFAVVWLLLPIWRAGVYLLSHPRLETKRGRALGVSLGALGLVLAFLAFVPMPSHFRADGIVRADPFAHVYAGMAGELMEVLAPSGTLVKAGEALLRLENFELARELEGAALELKKARSQAREALDVDPVRALNLQGYLDAILARQTKLRAEQEDLLVRAPCAGTWIAPDVSTWRGSLVPRGTEFGVVQGETQHYLSAVVRQADVARLFTGNVKATEVKVTGLETSTFKVTELQAIPAEQGLLPSASLGLAGGGQTPVEADEKGGSKHTGLVGAGEGKGTRTTEPFFEVRGYLGAEPGCLLHHGQRLVARLELPWEPLLAQWWRSLRQLFQRNYQV